MNQRWPGLDAWLFLSLSLSLSPCWLMFQKKKKKDLLKLWAVLFRTLPREIRREEIQKKVYAQKKEV